VVSFSLSFSLFFVSFGKEIFVVCTKLGVVVTKWVEGWLDHNTYDSVRQVHSLPKTEEKNTKKNAKFNEKKCT
jgi:hypothetical protein